MESEKFEEKKINECIICKKELGKKQYVCKECIEKNNLSIEPGARWLARTVDITIFGFGFVIVFGFFSLMILPDNIFNIYNIGNTLNFYFLLVYIFIESTMLAIWGTTPGKFLVNIQLLPLNQRKLTFGLALKRSFLVWIYGMGLGTGQIITYLYWLINLDRKGITRWDRKSKILAIQKKQNPKKKAIAITIVVLSFVFQIVVLLLP